MIIFFIIVFLILLYIYLNRRNSKYIANDTVALKSNSILVKSFSSRFYKTLKINVMPSIGRVLCDLRYKISKTSNSITQCRWHSDSQDPQTQVFMNEPLGDFYDLILTPENDTDISFMIKDSDNTLSITPYNSTIAPKDTKWSKDINIVPRGSTYLAGEKSSIVDFATSEASNIEMVIQCSNATLPKVSLFGSMELSLSTFTRVVEIPMNAGTYTPLNGKYYSDTVSLTHQRYFYIQIENAQANDLYINLIRRNY